MRCGLDVASHAENLAFYLMLLTYKLLGRQCNVKNQIHHCYLEL